MHLAIPHTPRIYARALLVRFQDTCLRSSRVFAVISRDILDRLTSAWCSCFPNSLWIYACVSILVSTHAQLHACLSPTYKFPFFSVIPGWHRLPSESCPLAFDRGSITRGRCSWPVVLRSEPIRLRIFQRKGFKAWSTMYPFRLPISCLFPVFAIVSSTVIFLVTYFLSRPKFVNFNLY